MFSELGGTYSNAGLFLGCRSINSGADFYDTIPSYTTNSNYPGGFIVSGYNGGYAGLALGVLDTGTTETPAGVQDYTSKIANAYTRRR